VAGPLAALFGLTGTMMIAGTSVLVIGALLLRRLTPGFCAERDAWVGHVPMAADVRSKCGWWEPESRLTAW